MAHIRRDNRRCVDGGINWGIGHGVSYPLGWKAGFMVKSIIPKFLTPAYAEQEKTAARERYDVAFDNRLCHLNCPLAFDRLKAAADQLHAAQDLYWRSNTRVWDAFNGKWVRDGK